MLENETKKKLREAKWLEIIEDGTNPSETIARYRKHCKEALITLVYLARRLPNDLQEDALPYENIKPLIESILNGSIESLHSYNANTKQAIYKGQNVDCDAELDRRILKIAACMVEEGVKICSQGYWKIQQDPRLNKLATDKLDETVMLCNAIAHPRVGKRLTVKYNIKKEIEWPEEK